MVEGKLYKCPDYYLLIYPTEEKATAMSPQMPAATKPGAVARANYWSKILNCTVRFAEPNEIFMCLNEPKGRYAHVLFGEKQGWIIAAPWLKIEEIEQ